MRVLYLFILICLIRLDVKAQTNTDAEFLFKMWLFADRVSSKESLKSDSLFRAFNVTTTLKLDTVVNDLFGMEYQFYFLKLYDIRNNKFIDNVTYSHDLSSTEIRDFSIPVNKYIEQYVICINPKTGQSYRLLGFNGNDFLNFLSDFKVEFKQKNDKKLSNNTFFSKYNIEGIDFKCLYNGLKAKEIDKNKYPCLIKCSDPVSIH